MMKLVLINAFERSLEELLFHILLRYEYLLIVLYTLVE